MPANPGAMESARSIPQPASKTQPLWQTFMKAERGTQAIKIRSLPELLLDLSFELLKKHKKEAISLGIYVISLTPPGHALQQELRERFITALPPAISQIYRAPAKSPTLSIVSEQPYGVPIWDKQKPAPESSTLPDFLSDPKIIEEMKGKAKEFRPTLEAVLKNPKLGIQNNPAYQKQLADMLESLYYVESKFNSKAGIQRINNGNAAFGIGQIQKATAEATAKKLNRGINMEPTGIHPDSIFNPKFNTLLAAKHSIDTLKIFPNYEFLAAAYNLGQTPVAEGISILASEKVAEAIKTNPTHPIIKERFLNPDGKPMSEQQIKDRIEKDFKEMQEPPASAFYLSNLDIALIDVIQDPDAKRELLAYNHINEKSLNDLVRYIAAANYLGHKELLHPRTLTWAKSTPTQTRS